MEERQIHIDIDSDTETRKGVFSNISMLTDEGPLTRIDFLNSDIHVTEENSRAVLASRVYMTRDDLVLLRNVLDSHIDGWKAVADAPKA